MKHKNTVLLITLILFVVGFTPPDSETFNSQQDDAANVGFRWGFGAIVGLPGSKRLVPITRDTVLKSGDEIKMVVQLTKPCFVYVIYLDSQGGLSLLFPYEFSQFTTDYKVGKNYYVPRSAPWFRLDENKGRETFYLLASSERLTALENLVTQYYDADDLKKSPIAQQVIAEIRDVRRRFRNFTTLAERPIAIGGNVRGREQRPDVASIATEISATNFYGKTFTIDHQ
ncbi:MAG TPA: DUF4384 domain-containing protein [Bacteroidota bacterium]|nr:DUF4384 domain-containing protein [Bacteroidota bacterium]